MFYNRSMANQELVAFVKAQIETKASLASITESLKGVGWSELDINDAIAAAIPASPPPQSAAASPAPAAAPLNIAAAPAQQPVQPIAQGPAEVKPPAETPIRLAQPIRPAQPISQPPAPVRAFPEAQSPAPAQPAPQIKPMETPAQPSVQPYFPAAAAVKPAEPVAAKPQTASPAASTAEPVQPISLIAKVSPFMAGGSPAAQPPGGQPPVSQMPAFGAGSAMAGSNPPLIPKIIAAVYVIAALVQIAFSGIVLIGKTFLEGFAAAYPVITGLASVLRAHPTVFGILNLVIAAAVITAALGLWRGRNWGRISAVVISYFFIIEFLIGAYRTGGLVSSTIATVIAAAAASYLLSSAAVRRAYTDKFAAPNMALFLSAFLIPLLAMGGTIFAAPAAPAPAAKTPAAPAAAATSTPSAAAPDPAAFFAETMKDFDAVQTWDEFVAFNQKYDSAQALQKIAPYAPTSTAASASSTASSSPAIASSSPALTVFAMLRAVTPLSSQITSVTVSTSTASSALLDIETSSTSTPSGTASLVLENGSWKLDQVQWNEVAPAAATSTATSASSTKPAIKKK